jgi:hypothetical protein
MFIIKNCTPFILCQNDKKYVPVLTIGIARSFSRQMMPFGGLPTGMELLLSLHQTTLLVIAIQVNPTNVLMVVMDVFPFYV